MKIHATSEIYFIVYPMDWLSGCFQLRAFSPMNNVHCSMLQSNFESLKLFGFNFNLISIKLRLLENGIATI